MTNFYLNVKQYGNNILYTGIKNNKRIKVKIPYSPSLFVPTNKESKYKTIFGENLQKKSFETIKQAKDFLEQYKDVENFKIYGDIGNEYKLISKLFKNDIDWNINQINIAIFDIEVASDPNTGGFASVNNPFQPIISITLKFSNKNHYYLFGYKDFSPPENVVYIKCEDEYTLCKKFIEIWSNNYPDIISGYFSSGFDIPYLVKRFDYILGEQETKRLSPWNIIKEKLVKKYDINQKNNDEIRYDIYGISQLDYLEVYKKYHPEGKSRENYKLDYICELEINERKLEYDGSLHKLYIEDHEKFYSYNIKDVWLVEQLDKKCKLFNLALTLAYSSRSKIDDIFHQTKMWDSILYHHLNEKNIQVPQNKIDDDSGYEGAYVYPTIIGKHDWIVTLDAQSLYPSIIMSSNIGPETIINNINDDLRQILDQSITIDNLLNKNLSLELLKNNKVTLGVNRQFFDNNKKGFFTEVVEKMFKERQVYKKKKLIAEQQLEKCIDKEERKKLEYDISKYDSLQNAKKLCMNSLYGVTASKYFRFYDIRLAEAITLGGQLCNRWVAEHVNTYLNSILKTNTNYIIAGDTDSLMLSLNSLIEKKCNNLSIKQKHEFVSKLIEKKIQPKINEFCNELSEYINFYDNKIFYKLEKICPSSLFRAKKMYALYVYSSEGVVYEEPKIVVKGLEIIKSSTPTAIRKKLKESLKIMLTRQEKDIKNFVSTFKQEYQNYKIEDISFPRGVNGLNKYYDPIEIFKKGTPIHVRASLLYNNLLKQKKLDTIYEAIKDGDKVKFCYLKLPNILKENVIAFPDKLPKEFDLFEFIDYNKMFNKTFVEPLKSLTDKINWDIEERFTIDDFFT